MIGEQYNISDVIDENNAVIANGGKPAVYHRVLNGISSTITKTKSFLSAASFKESDNVLIKAAVGGKKDNLLGMKESMIVGRLIPSGTGFVTRQLKRKAMEAIANENS